MNLVYGTKGLEVKYLQSFLHDNYLSTLNVSGTYDEDTHNALIEYLKLPNVQLVHDVHAALIDKYRMYGLDKYFLIELSKDFIVFTSKYNTSEVRKFVETFCNPSSNSDYVTVTNRDGDLVKIMQINKFVEKLGWELVAYTSHVTASTRDTNFKLRIIISKQNRINKFPNREMLLMVNSFNEDYLYEHSFNTPYSTNFQSNIAIESVLKNYDEFELSTVANNCVTSILEEDTNNRIAIIPCNPGDKFVIKHGYSSPQNIAIGVCDLTKEEILYGGRIKNGEIMVDAIPVNSDDSFNVSSSNVIKYVIPGLIKSSLSDNSFSEPKSLLIQLPYVADVATTESLTPVLIGDINGDGSVATEKDGSLKDYEHYKNGNMNSISKTSDFGILFHYIKGTLGRELTNIERIAANIYEDYEIDGTPRIDNEDLTRFINSYLKKFDEENNPTTSLGVTYYRSVLDVETNSDKLLVIKLDQTEDISFDFENMSDYNIPLDEYTQNPWMVHEKFLSYLFDMVIHMYSDRHDINYAQNIVQKYVDNSYRRLLSGYFDTSNNNIDRYINENKMLGNKYDNNTKSESQKIDDDNLRDILKQFQKDSNISFAFGFMDLETELQMCAYLKRMDVDLYE